MIKIRRARRITIGIGIGVACVSSGIPLAFAGTGSGQTQPVVVTNAASSPVPVAGTVSVANLPATQPVSGTVNIGNLPATQPVTGSVSISGSATVSVRQNEPFHYADLLPGETPTGAPSAAVIDIPAGKRLTVQSLTVASQSAVVSYCSAMSVYDVNGGQLFSVPLVTGGGGQCSAALSGEALFWTDQSKVFIQEPPFAADHSPSFLITVSGYLVPTT
jgi:hypothetical protein